MFRLKYLKIRIIDKVIYCDLRNILSTVWADIEHRLEWPVTILKFINYYVNETGQY